METIPNNNIVSIWQVNLFFLTTKNMVMFLIFYIVQDHNGTIENEELNGFMKDLMDLVQQVKQKDE